MSKFFAAAFLAALTLSPPLRRTAPERPKITGISHLAVYTSDPAATEHYYREIHRRGQGAGPRESAGRALRGQRDAVYRGAAAAAGRGHQPAGPHGIQHDERGRHAQISCREGLEDAGQGDHKAPTAAAGLRCCDPEGNKVSLCSRRQCQGSRCAERDRPSHHSCWIPGARPGQGRHVLSRPAWLQALLVRRHEGRQGRLGEPAGSRRPRLAGIHADERAFGLGHSREHVAAAPGRAGSFLDRRSIGCRCLQGAAGGQPAGRPARRRARRSAKTARGSSISTIRTAFGGVDELPRDREAVLLAVHGGGSGGVRASREIRCLSQRLAQNQKRGKDGAPGFVPQYR